MGRTGGGGARGLVGETEEIVPRILVDVTTTPWRVDPLRCPSIHFRSFQGGLKKWWKERLVEVEGSDCNYWRNFSRGRKEER